MSDTDTSSQPLSQRVAGLRERPEYVLALGTLWLYWVSSSYVQGYTSHFFARAEWFSPSVFALVSFAGDAVGRALIGAVLVVMLARYSATVSRWWHVAYAAWLGLLASVAIPYLLAMGTEYGSLQPSVVIGSTVIVLGWTLAPLFWRWRDRRWGQQMSDLESEQHRLAIAESSGATPEEIQSLTQAALHARAALFTPWFNFALRWGNVASVIALAFLFLFLVKALGFARAHSDYLAAVAMAKSRMSHAALAGTSSTIPSAQAQLFTILFTDGTAVLGVTVKDSRAMPYFRAGRDGDEVLLTTVGDLASDVHAALETVHKTLQEIEKARRDVETDQNPPPVPGSP